MEPIACKPVRPIPAWGWILSVLTLPFGLFMALGWARLIPWNRAILLAVSSTVAQVYWIGSMGRLEQGGAPMSTRTLFLLFGLLMIGSWGWLVFRIGRKADYWSPKVLQGWKRGGAFGLVVLLVAVAEVVLTRFS